ncbi:hypothetical protein VTK73DRAFT_10271 [Phialemonium thermophilum]|uniref:Uncharacterized protein n=1 Tax=Phialemonium thermophilum TaxID=223376 RepID=A0ABR3XHQ8_9PEZI
MAIGVKGHHEAAPKNPGQDCNILPHCLKLQSVIREAIRTSVDMPDRYYRMPICVVGIEHLPDVWRLWADASTGLRKAIIPSSVIPGRYSPVKIKSQTSLDEELWKATLRELDSLTGFDRTHRCDF